MRRRLLTLDGLSVLQCVSVCCSALQCIPVFSSVLQCVKVCCSMLQCVFSRLLSENATTTART